MNVNCSGKHILIHSVRQFVIFYINEGSAYSSLWVSSSSLSTHYYGIYLLVILYVFYNSDAEGDS